VRGGKFEEEFEETEVEETEIDGGTGFDTKERSERRRTKDVTLRQAAHEPCCRSAQVFLGCLQRDSLRASSLASWLRVESVISVIPITRFLFERSEIVPGQSPRSALTGSTCRARRDGT
jgi:hypothetical protein